MLRIWETDPEAAPKNRGIRADVVARFRSGYMLNGSPATLDNWRVTTGDPDVADKIHEMFGGEAPQQWETKSEDSIEVFTDTADIPIRIEGLNSIRQEMVLWGRNNKALRVCDGVEQHMDTDKGKPCECPAGYADRKDAAKSGRGCQPSTSLLFTLVDAPDMGVCRFSSASWSLVEDMPEITRQLQSIDGPALATLSLERVEYESKGRKKSFTRPRITITGAAE